MIAYFAWPAFVLLSWALGWFFIFRPMLAKTQAVMGVTKVLATTPTLTLWQRTLLHLEGAKTVITTFVVSMVGLATTVLGVLSNNTDILDNIKTEVPWTEWFTPVVALRFVTVIMLLVSFFHLYGKLTAAKTPPAT